MTHAEGYCMFLSALRNFVLESRNPLKSLTCNCICERSRRIMVEFADWGPSMRMAFLKHLIASA